jgi:biopolymer transport protein ExbB
MFLNKNARTDEKVFSQYLDLLSKGKSEEAAVLCSDAKNSWGRIFLYGTTTGKSDVQQIDHLLEDAANVEVARMEKNLGYLSVIAGVAPLLGFIGTIIGVITIFYDISIKGEITIPVISEGLYTKMVSSATGLVVGIIAFTSHHLFQNQVDNFVNKVQEQALNLKVALSK